MDTTRRAYVDDNKTYKIPVTWEVYGEMEIDAKSLNDAIHIAEQDTTPYPPTDGAVDGSLDIDYDIACENNREDIGTAPSVEHDPEKCGCTYRGMDMWSCGHIDNMV